MTAELPCLHPFLREETSLPRLSSVRKSLLLRQYLETPIFCGKSTIYTRYWGFLFLCYTDFDRFCDIFCYIQPPEIRLKGAIMGALFL